MKQMRSVLMIGVAVAGMAVAGCSSFEQTSYQTLAATTGVLNQAQADYEAKTIPQTKAAYTAITKAKAAEVLAIQGMETYEELKAAKGTTSTQLTAQENAEIALLANLPALIADVKALYSTPPATTTPATP